MANKSWLGLSVLACIGCCALPFVVGAAGGIAALSHETWICGGILLLGALAWYVMKRRQMTKANAQCCNVDCSCKTGS